MGKTSNPSSISKKDAMEFRKYVLDSVLVNQRLRTDKLPYISIPLVTEIQDVKTSASAKFVGNGKIYDLSGREIIEPTTGIYIKDGVKYVVTRK